MKKNFIILFHFMESAEKARIDFKSGKPASDFLELARLKGYKLYQYIQNDSTYIMPVEDLRRNKIGFAKLSRKEKTWFGLSKKTMTDFLITPKDGFYYPYSNGSYLYIFTKQEINLINFRKWLDKEFSSRFGDIDETFTGFKNLLNDDDYLIATNQDFQNEFGIIGKKEITKEIISKFINAELAEFKLENMTNDG